MYQPGGGVVSRTEREAATARVLGGSPHIRLTSEMAIYHAERVTATHPDTMAMVKMVFPKAEVGPEMDEGFQHVLGLIDLTLKLRLSHPGVPVVWARPEQYLHPSEQCALADVLTLLTKEAP